MDEGEDTLTSFDAMMLVNIEGNIEEIQMELYDSGASHHMLPTLSRPFQELCLHCSEIYHCGR